MTETQTQLWEKVQDFALDAENASLPFSARLARENGWTPEYTQRVILEYKKFIYLCCASGQEVTPSDAVDQVWHMHLTYSRNYWTDFCQNTLGQEIHHNPTEGGSAEREKYKNCYTTTAEVYKEHFGEEPPADIWPDEATRFSDIDFRRVNIKKNWIIRKPAWMKPDPRKAFLAPFVLAGLFIAGTIAATSIFASIIVTLFFVIIPILSVYSDPDSMKRGYFSSSSSGCSSGCSSGGCSWGSDSGCSSGCGSGCSGCGGGCGGCGGGCS